MVSAVNLLSVAIISSGEIVVLLDANCASSIKLRLKSSGPIVLGKSKAKKEFCFMAFNKSLFTTPFFAISPSLS